MFMNSMKKVVKNTTS